jgi:hypothetical protein
LTGKIRPANPIRSSEAMIRRPGVGLSEAPITAFNRIISIIAHYINMIEAKIE